MANYRPDAQHPHVYSQDFIRDKSVQPRIPTVNDILQE